MQNSSNKILQILGGFIAFGFGLLQGIDWLFTKYEIGNFYFNIILILLLLGFIVSIVVTFKKNRSVNNTTHKQISKIKFAVGTILSMILVFLFIYFFKKINDSDSLINEKIPQIIKWYDNNAINLTFLETRKLIEDYPNNEIIKNYYDKSSKYVYLKTNLKNIDVSVLYSRDSSYTYIGKTPIDSFVVANTGESHKLKMSFNGRDYVENAKDYHKYIFPKNEITNSENFKVFLGTNVIRMWFQGVEFRDTEIEPFMISKNEVSNVEYQKFIEDGGYENPSYWDFPFQVGSKILDFNSSIKSFTGKYGKSGPSNWSYGKHPAGLENHPVTGLSWFEARAYSRYKKLSLPNVYQWLYASGETGFSASVNKKVRDNSNYDSSQTTLVDDSRGSSNGLNNIAGNVKEWVLNPNGINQQRFSILGGSFSEQPYTFNNYYSLSPMDRSIGNGIRLAKTLNENHSSLLDNKIIPEYNRNISELSDVSDEVFDVYKSQFDYENSPVNAITTTIENFQDGYTAQKFEMPTTYESNEKLFGYIVYSNKFNDKYNPVIIHPTAGGIIQDEDSGLPQNLLITHKHLIDEGYAVIHPIYNNTFSRVKNYDTFWPDESETYKNTIIKIGKDFKRSIDYIESRNDFKFENLFYYGYSWGSTTSNYLLAIDDRVKAAFILVGGLMMQKSKKEIEAHYYVRRIKTPIFHIIGKQDGIFGYKESYLPWKELIGTPKENLKVIIYDELGHGIPRDTIIKYQANWYKQFSVK